MKEERWVTLKDGRKVKIKSTSEYMNDLIRNKNKKEKFIDIDADNVDEFNKKRKDYVEKNLKIDDINKNDIGNLKAILDDKVIGSLKYEINNGKYVVSYINIDDDYRRSGIATRLYKQFQQKIGNNDMYFNEFTDEGKKLINKIGKVSKTNDNKYKGRINL